MVPRYYTDDDGKDHLMDGQFNLEALQTFADMARNKLPDDGVVTFEVDLIRQLIGTIDALVEETG